MFANVSLENEINMEGKKKHQKSFPGLTLWAKNRKRSLGLLKKSPKFCKKLSTRLFFQNFRISKTVLTGNVVFVRNKRFCLNLNYVYLTYKT